MLDQIEYEDYMKNAQNLTLNNDYEFRAWRPNIEAWKQNVLFKHIAKLVAEKDIYRNWVENKLKKHPVDRK